MPNAVAIKVGDKYNKLTAIGKALNRGNRVIWVFECECGSKTGIQSCRVIWVFECECGSKTGIQSCRVAKGTVKQCHVCAKLEAGKANKVHGLSKHPLHKIWDGILGRCYNPNNDHYHNYGGRGISMCDEWKSSFKCFYDDMVGGYKKGLTIDRRDNDLGYNKNNCRWVTNVVNSQNTRGNKLNEDKVRFIRSANLTAKELANKFGTGVATINDVRQRISWANII